jgi:uncharacterized protein YcgL (UPF0745 family)
MLVSGQNFAVNVMNLNKRPIQQRHWSEGASSRGACSWCCAVYHAKKKPPVFMLVRRRDVWTRMQQLAVRDLGHGHFQYQMQDPNTEEISLVMSRFVKKIETDGA